MSTEAIERVLRESSCSDPETLAEAVGELEELRRACRALFIGTTSTVDETEANSLLLAIGQEAS